MDILKQLEEGKPFSGRNGMRITACYLGITACYLGI